MLLFPFHFCFYSIFNLHVLHHSAHCCESGLFSVPGGVVIVECAVFLSSSGRVGSVCCQLWKNPENGSGFANQPFKVPIGCKHWTPEFWQNYISNAVSSHQIKSFWLFQGCEEKSPGSGSEQMKLELLIHIAPNIGALKKRKPGPAWRNYSFVLFLPSSSSSIEAYQSITCKTLNIQ